MSLLDNRSSNDILEGKFIRKSLQDTATSLNARQREYMSSRGFNENNNWNDRSFNVTDNKMEYIHLKKHRFVDMKTVTTKDGKKNKKFHPIHNRMIFGHYNYLIRELTIGFTEQVKQDLMSLED